LPCFFGFLYALSKPFGKNPFLASQLIALVLAAFSQLNRLLSAFFRADAPLVRWLMRLRSISADRPKAKARTTLYVAAR